MKTWRVVAAFVVLSALAYFGARLAPIYFRNLELQRFLEETAVPAASGDAQEERIRVAVVEKAARLGLPIRSDQVRLKRSTSGFRIEVRYTVPVDLWLYTVDLHFAPRAGGGREKPDQSGGRSGTCPTCWVAHLARREGLPTQA